MRAVGRGEKRGFARGVLPSRESHVGFTADACSHGRSCLARTPIFPRQGYVLTFISELLSTFLDCFASSPEPGSNPNRRETPSRISP